MHENLLMLRGKIEKLASSGFLIWMLTTVAIAIAAFYLVRSLTLERLARAQVKANPFTLVMESYDFSGGDTTGILFARETVARRSDGATVRVNSMAGQLGLQAGETEKHILLLDGQQFTVYDGVGSVVRFPRLPVGALAFQKERILNPPANCVFPGYTLSGYATIRGYKVAIVKLGPIENNNVTVWFAPELGCEKLQYRVEVPQADGSTTLKSETKAVNLTVGEPDPRLFEIPVGYASVAPSEALHKEAERLGVPWTTDMQREADMRDAAYLGRKPASARTP